MRGYIQYRNFESHDQSFVSFKNWYQYKTKRNFTCFSWHGENQIMKLWQIKLWHYLWHTNSTQLHRKIVHIQDVFIMASYIHLFLWENKIVSIHNVSFTKLLHACLSMYPLYTWYNQNKRCEITHGPNFIFVHCQCPCSTQTKTIPNSKKCCYCMVFLCMHKLVKCVTGTFYQLFSVHIIHNNPKQNTCNLGFCTDRFPD